MLILIAAMDKSRIIGNNNDIPWHIPKDFLHFKKTTLNHSIIMGYNTWLSLPMKPLPKRTNIIITANHQNHIIKHDNIHSYDSLESCFEVHNSDDESIFVIGGQSIYEQTIDIADKMIISQIHGEYVGNKYFPVISESKWMLTDTVMDDGFDILYYTKKS